MQCSKCNATMKEEIATDASNCYRIVTHYHCILCGNIIQNIDDLKFVFDFEGEEALLKKLKKSQEESGLSLQDEIFAILEAFFPYYEKERR